MSNLRGREFERCGSHQLSVVGQIFSVPCAPTQGPLRRSHGTFPGSHSHSSQEHAKFTAPYPTPHTTHQSQYTIHNTEHARHRTQHTTQHTTHAGRARRPRMAHGEPICSTLIFFRLFSVVVLGVSLARSGKCENNESVTLANQNHNIMNPLHSKICIAMMESIYVFGTFSAMGWPWSLTLIFHGVFSYDFKNNVRVRNFITEC